jgi:hypothetical protein
MGGFRLQLLPSKESHCPAFLWSKMESFPWDLRVQVSSPNLSYKIYGLCDIFLIYSRTYSFKGIFLRFIWSQWHKSCSEPSIHTGATGFCSRWISTVTIVGSGFVSGSSMDVREAVQSTAPLCLWGLNCLDCPCPHSTFLRTSPFPPLLHVHGEATFYKRTLPFWTWSVTNPITFLWFTGIRPRESN